MTEQARAGQPQSGIRRERSHMSGEYVCGMCPKSRGRRRHLTDSLNWEKVVFFLQIYSFHHPLSFFFFFPCFCFWKDISLLHGLEGTVSVWTGKVTLASGEAGSLTLNFFEWLPRCCRSPLERDSAGPRKDEEGLLICLEIFISADTEYAGATTMKIKPEQSGKWWLTFYWIL